MPNNAYYKDLVDSQISAYANNTIVVYKVSSVATDIYSDGDVTYDAGTNVICIARTQPDIDELTPVGRLNDESIQFTVSRKELETKFPLASARDWVTLEDIIFFEDKYYTITEIQLKGRAHTDFTVLTFVAKENPDISVGP